MKKRKAIPLGVRLEVALRQLAGLLGCAPGDLALDHDPALNWRPWNSDQSDTVPPANDPACLVYRRKKGDHDVKTFGPGGEKRIHTRGSDLSEPLRLDRISKKHSESQQRILSKGSATPTEITSAPARKPSRSSKMNSRPFPGGSAKKTKRARPRKASGPGSTISRAWRAEQGGDNS